MHPSEYALRAVTAELLTVAVIMLAIVAVELFCDHHRTGKWPWQ